MKFVLLLMLGLWNAFSAVVSPNLFNFNQTKQDEQILKLSQNTSLSRSISDIFNVLPSLIDLEPVIQSADPAILTKLLKTITKTKKQTPCMEMKKYLTLVTRKIADQIIKKLKEVQQNRKFSEKTLYELQYLENIQTQLENQTKSLGKQISLSQTEILEGVVLISSINKKINENKEEKEKLSLQLTNMSNLITKLKQDVKIGKQQLLGKKIDIATYDTDITRLEKQLAEAKRKKLIQVQIHNSILDTLNKNQQLILEYQARIQSNAKKIKDFEKENDMLTIDLANKQLSVQNERQTLSKAIPVETVKNKQLEVLKSQIRQLNYKNQSNPFSIPYYQNQINVLKLINSKLHEQLAQITDQCQQNTQNKANIFLVKQEQFKIYMRAIFSNKFSSLIQEISDNNVDVNNFIKINRGIKPSDQQISRTSQCAVGEQIITGQIINIIGSILEILSNKEIFSIKLDSCTQIESLVEKIIPGSKILSRVSSEVSEQYHLKSSHILLF